MFDLETVKAFYQGYGEKVAAIRRELGRGWALGVVLWQCIVAYIAAGAAYWICVLFGG